MLFLIVASFSGQCHDICDLVFLLLEFALQNLDDCLELGSLLITLLCLILQQVVFLPDLSELILKHLDLFLVCIQLLHDGHLLFVGNARLSSL